MSITTKSSVPTRVPDAVSSAKSRVILGVEVPFEMSSPSPTVTSVTVPPVAVSISSCRSSTVMYFHEEALSSHIGNLSSEAAVDSSIVVPVAGSASVNVVPDRVRPFPAE